MTRRGRLARLEAQRHQQGAAIPAGVFDADPLAGVWREVGGQGRTLPLDPDRLEADGERAQAGCLLLCAGGSKVILGVSAGDL